MRKGLGKGMGMGYKNLVPKDPYVHSLSAKGVKTKKYLPYNRSFETDEEMDAFVFDQMNAIGKEGHCQRCGMTQPLSGRYCSVCGSGNITDVREVKFDAKYGTDFDTQFGADFDAKKSRAIRQSLVPDMGLMFELEEEVKFMKKLEDLEEAGVVTFQSDTFGEVNIKDELKLTRQIIRERVKEKYGDKIPVKSVTIKGAEGEISYSDQFPKKFKNITEANKFLMENAYRFPKTGGYDKHDFVVEWVDGFEYEGRMDTKHPSMPDNDLDMGKHIKDFVGWTVKQPVNEKGIPRVTKEEKKSAKDLLENYSFDAKGKLNLLQRLGLQEKPKRGRPEKVVDYDIVWDKIPTRLTPDQKRKQAIKLTKREQKIAVGNLAGADIGFVAGGLLGGLGGMVVGVPIGVITGNVIAKKIAGKPRGRPLKYKKKQGIIGKLLETREDRVLYDQMMLKKERQGVA